jgi:hypothetical protein
MFQIILSWLIGAKRNIFKTELYKWHQALKINYMNVLRRLIGQILANNLKKT